RENHLWQHGRSLAVRKNHPVRRKNRADANTARKPARKCVLRCITCAQASIQKSIPSRAASRRLPLAFPKRAKRAQRSRAKKQLNLFVFQKHAEILGPENLRSRTLLILLSSWLQIFWVCGLCPYLWSLRRFLSSQPCRLSHRSYLQLIPRAFCRP